MLDHKFDKLKDGVLQFQVAHGFWSWEDIKPSGVRKQLVLEFEASIWCTWRARFKGQIDEELFPLANRPVVEEKMILNTLLGYIS